MTQTTKGRTWRLGMKIHVGAYSKSGLIRTVRTTTEKVAYCAEAENLPNGKENQGYR